MQDATRHSRGWAFRVPSYSAVFWCLNGAFTDRATSLMQLLLFLSESARSDQGWDRDEVRNPPSHKGSQLRCWQLSILQSQKIVNRFTFFSSTRNTICLTSCVEADLFSDMRIHGRSLSSFLGGRTKNPERNGEGKRYSNIEWVIMLRICLGCPSERSLRI